MQFHLGILLNVIVCSYKYNEVGCTYVILSTASITLCANILGYVCVTTKVKETKEGGGNVKSAKSEL